MQVEWPAQVLETLWAWMPACRFAHRSLPVLICHHILVPGSSTAQLSACCLHICPAAAAGQCEYVLVLVQAFQTAEELEAEDSWFCSKCKRHVQASKKLDLWAVPEVLVVHLKRFFFTRARRDKLDVQVDFPLENWDLSDVLPRQQVTPLRPLTAAGVGGVQGLGGWGRTGLVP